MRREFFRQLERKEQLKRDLEQISKEASPYRAYAEEFGANEEGEGILNNSEPSHIENTIRRQETSTEEEPCGNHELSKDYPKSMHHETPNIQRNPTPHPVPRQVKITKYQGVSEIGNPPRRQKLSTTDSQAFTSQALIPSDLSLPRDCKQTKADWEIGVLDEGEEVRDPELPTK